MVHGTNPPPNLYPIDRAKKYGKLILRWSLRLLLALILLLLLLTLLIQLPPVQNRLTGIIMDGISTRTGVRAEIDRMVVRLPGNLRMDGLYMEDHRGDTLIYAGRVRAGIRLTALFSNKLHVRSLGLDDGVVQITRLQPDSLFNYELLLQALENLTGEQAPADGHATMHPATESHATGQPPGESPAAGPPSPGISIEMNKITLNSMRLRYADHHDGIDLRFSFANFSTSLPLVYPGFTGFHFGDTFLSDARLQAVISSPSVPRPEPEPAPAALPELNLKIQGLDIREFAATVNGTDFPISISGLQLSLQDLLLSKDTLSLYLKNIAADLPGRFRLDRFSARVNLGKESLSIDELFLETDMSGMEASLGVGMDPLNPDLENLGPVPVDFRLNQMRLGTDLSDLLEELGVSLPVDVGSLTAAGHFHGRINDLQIERANIDIPGALSLSIDGSLRGLPDMNAVVADIPEMSLAAGREVFKWPLVKAWMPDGMIPPDTLEVLANVHGSLTKLDAGLSLSSNLGGIVLDGFYRDQDQPVYSVTARMDDLQAGLLLGMPELFGNVTATLNAKGSGLKPETADAEFSASIGEAFINGYHYRGLALGGYFRGQVLDADLAYGDENLSFTASNRLAVGPGTPVLESTWEIDRLNTHALGLTSDTLVFSTRMHADVRLTQPDFLDGHIRFDRSRLEAYQRNYSLDSLVVTASSGEGEGRDEMVFEVDIHSRIFRAVYAGNISPAGIPAVLSAHINQYMDLAGQDDGDPAGLAGQDDGYGRHGEEENPAFSLELQVLPSSWYTDVLFPDLQSFEEFSIRSGFDAQSGIFSLDALVPSLVYDGMDFSGLDVRSNTVPGVMDVHLGIFRFEGFGLEIFNMLLDGRFTGNDLAFSLGFDDAQQDRWLHLGGRMRSDEGMFVTSFDRDLILNGEEWAIAEGNAISYGTGILLVDKLEISREGSSLQVQSSRARTSSPDGSALSPDDVMQQADTDPPPDEAMHLADASPPLELVFDHFSIENFFPSDGPPMAAGIIDGQLTIFDVLSSPSINAAIQIRQLAFKGDPLGDIRLDVESEELSLFRFSASVHGHGNQLELSGFYNAAAGEEDFRLDLDLSSLDLATLEAFTFGELSELQGTASGSLLARGSPADPEFSGSLRFAETSFRVSFSNVLYHLDQQEISFDPSAVRFRNFTLTDEAGNSARLNGSLNLVGLPDVGFDLGLTANNFLAMNIPAGQNPLFSGRLLVGSDLRLRGKLGSPLLDGRFALNEGSFFHMIVPQSDPQAVGAEGVVAFISPGDALVWPVEGVDQETDPLMSALRNLDISINVEVDPTADLRVVIDEYAGDYLQVRGGGLLTYSTDPGGRISLAGRYELTEGTYLLTFYDIIRRQFSIRRGSSILWTGNLMDPVVDITAVYSTRTSVRELFEHQPGGGDDPRFRQQFPFQVLLKMRGNMLQPDIDFEIVLPPEHQGALDGRLQTRINELNRDESERNKQVFALLMLESFIPDNPFAAVGDGPGLEAAARTSVSRMLSQQLNRLSGQYIRGVDIQFDLQSHEDFMDDGNGGTTQLNIEVSRNFFDERIRVTVGGNVELEDERRRETSAGDIAGDFSIEYLLTPDGSLVIKGFRKKEFGDLFEGQVIETGVALMFVKTYNKLRELFIKREDPAGVPEPLRQQ